MTNLYKRKDLYESELFVLIKENGFKSWTINRLREELNSRLAKSLQLNNKQISLIVKHQKKYMVFRNKNGEYLFISHSGATS